MICPACGGKPAGLVLRQDRVPVLQNRVWDSREAAREAPTGRLELTWCGRCDHLWNAAFDAEKVVYDTHYDNCQHASNAFQAHLLDRVQDLSEWVEPGQVVVEIGCGQGGFLASLCAHTGTSGIGFDPAFRGGDLPDGVLVEADCYGPRFADIPADLVVARHVVEHVPDTFGLLHGVRAALADKPDATVVFECPDADWILEHQVPWDLFYEHVHYFTRDSLRAAFARAGFEVVEHRSVFEGQYQWLVARPAQLVVLPPKKERSAAQLRSLVHGWQAWLEGLRVELDGARVALWGAGAKGTTLARLLDPDGDVLVGIVDLNPDKQGGFVGGTGHRVLAPAELPDLDVDEVWVMNPAYAAEIRQQVRREHLNVRVRLAPAPRSASCSPCSPSAFPPETAPGTSSAA